MDYPMEMRKLWLHFWKIQNSVDRSSTSLISSGEGINKRPILIGRIFNFPYFSIKIIPAHVQLALLVQLLKFRPLLSRTSITTRQRRTFISHNFKF